MLIFALICLSLSLIAVTGLQFFYLLYLERIGNEYKKRVRELEKYCLSLSERLHRAEQMIRIQPSSIGDTEDEATSDEEVWADILEDR